MKEFAKFIAYNSFFGTVFFLGVVKEIDGFLNLTRFFIWFAFLLLVLIYAVIEEGGEEEWRKVSEKGVKTPHYSKIAGRLLSIVYTLTLVFYGHILLAIVYLAASLVAYTMVKRIETFWESEG